MSPKENETGRVVLYLGAPPQGSKTQRLLRCLHDYAKRSGIALPTPLDIVRAPHKKPMANQEGLHFSVSHSGRLWACAAGTQPIGIDLERYREGCPAEAIARRFFHPEEYGYLKNHGFSSDSFFPLWTAKESYVKYTGEGISDLYSSFSVVENRALCGTVNGVHYRHFPVEQGYSLCVCTQAPPSVQFVFL